MQLPIHLPQGTHSHAAVTHDGGVIVMGGLNEEMVPLNMCYYIKHEEDDWSLLQLAISLPFTPRYKIMYQCYIAGLHLCRGSRRSSYRQPTAAKSPHLASIPGRSLVRGAGIEATPHWAYNYLSTYIY